MLYNYTVKPQGLRVIEKSVWLFVIIDRLAKELCDYRKIGLRIFKGFGKVKLRSKKAIYPGKLLLNKSTKEEW